MNEANDHTQPDNVTPSDEITRPDSDNPDGRSAARPAADEGDLKSSLAAMARLPADAPGLEPTLTRIAELAVAAIPGAEGAGVTLLQAGHHKTIVASTPFVADVDAIQYGIGEGPCISAAANRITVRSGHLGGESQWPHFGPRVKEIGVHSVLSLPLLLGDDSLPVVGAINVYARPRDVFDDRAQEVGEHFAISAAIAVRNAQILEQSRHVATVVQQALPRQAAIDQAIGALISRHGGTPAAALAELQATSDRTHTSLADTAQKLIDEPRAENGSGGGHPSIAT